MACRRSVVDVNRTSGFHPCRLGVDSHTERALVSHEVSTAKHSRSAGVQMPMLQN
jgi:hypothetical protein